MTTIRTMSVVVALIFTFSLRIWPQTAVLTYHNDVQRTGQNLAETILTPNNVNSATFGKVFSFSTVGNIYAQPLYMPGLIIPAKGTHNVRS